MGDFGAILRWWREERGFSQRELGRLAGLSHSAVSLLERGEVEPRWATVRALCGALGISVAVLDLRPKGKGGAG